MQEEKQTSKNKIKKRKHRKRKITVWSVIRTFLIIILSLVIALCVTVIILYKLGQSKLFQKAQDAEVLVSELSDSDTSSVASVRERYLGSNIDWQDDWVVYDGKVYEYNRNNINLLILGIDRAGGLSSESDYSNWDAGQADAIFVLSLNPDEKKISIVAIPRNSMVVLDIYDEDGNATDVKFNQICLQYGYAGGGENALGAMKKVASDVLYGLPIMGEVAIGYDAIPLINDTVGGVEVEVIETIPWDEELYEGNVLTLNGEQAYLYVQARDTSVVGSPTQRLMRQKQYLNGLIHTAFARIKENLGIVIDAYNDLAPYMNTNISLDEMTYLAIESMGYEFNMDEIYMLEGEDVTSSTTLDDGTDFIFDDYYLNEDNRKETVIKVFFKEVEEPQG